MSVAVSVSVVSVSVVVVTSSVGPLLMLNAHWVVRKSGSALVRTRRENITHLSHKTTQEKPPELLRVAFERAVYLFQENTMHFAKPPETQEDPRKLRGSRSW